MNIYYKLYKLYIYIYKLYKKPSTRFILRCWRRWLWYPLLNVKLCILKSKIILVIVLKNHSKIIYIYIYIYIVYNFLPPIPHIEWFKAWKSFPWWLWYSLLSFTCHKNLFFSKNTVSPIWWRDPKVRRGSLVIKSPWFEKRLTYRPLSITILLKFFAVPLKMLLIIFYYW